MASQVQLRRGTTSDHSAFTGALGEVTYDTTVKSLRVHDGSTVSGLLLANVNSPVLTTPVLTNPTVTNYTETAIANASLAATYTFNSTLSTGTFFDLTTTTTTTFTMPTAVAGKSFFVILKGGNSVTFTSVKWASGTAPTISGTCLMSFFSDGTSWYGSSMGTGFA